MEKALALAAIAFGVLEFTTFSPFPDISLALISAGTPKVFNMFMVILLPMLTIISGSVALFHIKPGFVSLFALFSIYLVVSVLGFAKVPFWHFLTIDYIPGISKIEVINFGNCMFFLLFVVLIYLNIFSSNKPLQPTAGASTE